MDLIAAQPVRVPAAVVALVHLHHDLADPGESRTESRHHFLRLGRVLPQQFQLLGREPLAVEQFPGNLQHAQIVHQGAQPQRQAAALVVLHLHAQPHGQHSRVRRAPGPGPAPLALAHGFRQQFVIFVEPFQHLAQSADDRGLAGRLALCRGHENLFGHSRQILIDQLSPPGRRCGRIRFLAPHVHSHRFQFGGCFLRLHLFPGRRRHRLRFLDLCLRHPIGRIDLDWSGPRRPASRRPGTAHFARGAQHLAHPKRHRRSPP